MGLPIDICAICGDIIPEGRHICYKCEREYVYPYDCVHNDNDICELFGRDCEGECALYKQCEKITV